MFPVFAVVPLKHDRLRRVLGRDVNVGKQNVAGADDMAGGSTLEGVAVRAEGGGFRVGGPAVAAFPVPRPIGRRAERHLVLKPNALRLVPARNGPHRRTQHLNVAVGDLAARLDADLDLAAFGSGHFHGLRRRRVRLRNCHVTWIINRGTHPHEDGALDQSNPVLNAPGLATVDAIAEAVFVVVAEAGPIHRDLPQFRIVFIAVQIELVRRQPGVVVQFQA